MRRISFALLPLLSISLSIPVSVTCLPAFAQLDNTSQMISSNDSTDQQLLNNQTRIMENTSGIIDDAIDALKESFGPFFGK
ncbi:MAG TPA: hypothetical protein VJ772_01020 [Nitrososphaeraceae archaeon]|nr:hypothetical protein [Nitrososphaeraceae archaeon]